MSLSLIALYIKEMTAAYNQLIKDGKSPEQRLETLIELERSFISHLRGSGKGALALKKLIYFLKTEKDMRSIRSFFRERDCAFDVKFKKAIQSHDYDFIYDNYDLNFMFCNFVVQNIRVNQKLHSLFRQLKAVRDDIITCYLHYTLNRAKVFLRYSNNILTFDDLVSSASEGLVIAVDKYKLDPKSPTPFHMVAIGRMVSNLIALQASSTPVKLTYRPARQLYMVRKLMLTHPNMSYAEIAHAVGMTEQEVVDLLHALHLVSLDDLVSDNDENTSVFLYNFLPDGQAHNNYEQVEIEDMLVKACAFFHKQLTLLQQKVLRLRGVDFYQYIDVQKSLPLLLKLIQREE